MATTEHKPTINGRRVHYWESGNLNALPILLLHGGIADAETNWASVIPGLAEDYHVIAPDLPGFGQSDAIPAMKIQDMIHWVVSLMEVLEMEQAVLVGNSFGGLLARLVAAAHPQNVPALVLVNGGIPYDLSAFARLLLRIPVLRNLIWRLSARLATSQRTLTDMFYDPAQISSQLKQSAAQNAPGFAKVIQITTQYPLPDKLTPRISTLILWGKDDGLISVEDGKRLQNAIPDAEFVEIADCGHMPQIEAPDVFNWQIKSFLSALRKELDSVHNE